MGVSSLRRFAFLLSLCYPLMLHIAITNGYPRAALWTLLGLALVYSLLLLCSSQHGGNLLLALSLALASVISLLLDDASIIYLPPILISGVLLYTFGHTLMPGKEPLISRLAHHIDGIHDSRTLRYTRRLTWVWSLFFALMLVETILLPLFVTKETWSLFTNLINYLLIFFLFAVELLVRLIYLGRRPSPRAIIQAFSGERMHQWMRD